MVPLQERLNRLSQHFIRLRAVAALGLAPLFLTYCAGSDEEPARVWECSIAKGKEPAFVSEIGCEADFKKLASEPVTSILAGARATKTIVDQAGGDTLYFQDSVKFKIHWEFAREHLSGKDGLPIVPDLSSFNTTEYYSPDRRFLLGSVAYHVGPDVWAYEISPYDTASPVMIEKAFRAVRAHAYFGDRLVFHPTSDAILNVAKALPDDIPVVSTEQLFEGVEYQPYVIGEAYGLLRFYSAKDLETEFVGFRDIAVLDEIPNDISVVSGIVTSAFQTPLAHIVVLSQNRGTPDMALRGAFDDPKLRALEGEWVHIETREADYTIKKTTQAKADAWWEAHRPPKVQVPTLDLTVTDIRDSEDILDIKGLGLEAALKAAIPAFGGKASHYGGLALIGDDVSSPEAFAIPAFYYRQFMEENGLDALVEEILNDETVRANPAKVAPKLEALRAKIEKAPVNKDFEAALMDKLSTRFPDAPRFKYRSSTNVEDLDGFTGAGLYESFAGDADDPDYPVLDAVRKVWAGLWGFRAFQEREYRSIDHRAIAMALQVNTSFVDEEANGVAVTANIFDREQLEPAFFINAQIGENSVVSPGPGITTDQILYYYDMPNQPIVWVGRSNLVPEGESVLTRRQTHELGTALNALHSYFREAYGDQDCYALEVDWKLDNFDGESRVWIKQARPYQSWCK